MSVGLLRRVIAAIEPWYDWGIYEVSRLDAHEPDFSDESYGQVRFCQLQWLGVHFLIQVGRTPPKIAPDQVAACKARHIGAAQPQP